MSTPDSVCIRSNELMVESEENFSLDEFPVESIPALLNPDGTPYEIPVEGSLGLLALGYTGIMKWREKRAASIEDRSTDRNQAAS